MVLAIRFKVVVARRQELLQSFQWVGVRHSQGLQLRAVLKRSQALLRAVLKRSQALLLQSFQWVGVRHSQGPQLRAVLKRSQISKSACWVTSGHTK